MPRKLLPFIFPSFLIAGLLVFFFVESARPPARPAAAPKELGAMLLRLVEAPQRGASSVHQFRADPREWHIQVGLTLERYAALEPVLEEALRTFPARVKRKEQELKDGTIRFLWDIRADLPGGADKSVLLFICPQEKAVKAGVSGGPDKPVAAIIIDDIGYNLDMVRALVSIGRPLTLAILPDTPQARNSALAGHEGGLEIMLHVPLESVGHSATRARTTIDVGMNKAEIEKNMAAWLDEIPYVRGVNNHAGSLATEDPAVMMGVLQIVKSRGLYFIDSRTSRNTVAFDSAGAMGVPAASRRVFLDQPPGRETVKTRLEELFRIAAARGGAVAIGHARTETIEALRLYLPLADRAGVRLVAASGIVR
jgi:polysaccharide deacetylase 2 family uncharacterized protein YibQ